MFGSEKPDLVSTEERL